MGLLRKSLLEKNPYGTFIIISQEKDMLCHS
jgi:hypothetical protein